MVFYEKYKIDWNNLFGSPECLSYNTALKINS